MAVFNTFGFTVGSKTSANNRSCAIKNERFRATSVTIEPCKNLTFGQGIIELHMRTVSVAYRVVTEERYGQ